MRTRLAITAVALHLLAVIFSVPANADEPPSTPILRVEPGTHTGVVHKVVVDSNGEFVVTVSSDKTARVWSLPDLELRSVLRVPVAEGNEGQLYAAALSPDGRTLAVGGWTGWTWDKKTAIYLFDMESGRLTRRLTGYPEGIGALAFSPDGKRLAIGLLGQSGLYIMRTDDFAVTTRDTEYADKVIELEFNAQGQLVVGALDGLIRLYDADGKLRQRKRVPAGNKPAGVRFSPDGAHVAVGFFDTARTAVLRTAGLEQEWATAPEFGANTVSFYAVSWMAGGARLCAGGEARGASAATIRCWPANGKGKPLAAPVAKRRLGDMASLPNGQILFTTDDPSIGILQADGRVRAVRDAEVISFARAQVPVSADGALVKLPGSGAQQYFSVFEPAPPADTRKSLREPVRTAAGIRIAYERDGYRTRFNGTLLELEPYERAHSHAISADGRGAILGTEWSLHRYDARGARIWQQAVPAAAYALNTSADGQWVIAGLGDGTLRWYRMEDGVEVLALFVQPKSQEWIAWIPAGYYMSSAQGDNYIGWHMNQGKESVPEFVLAAQMDRLLYRPDLVQAFFKSKGRSLPEISGGKGFDISRLAEVAPPRLQLERMRTVASAPGRTRVRVAARRSRLPMRDVAVFVNNIPVTPASERRLSGAAAEAFEREFELDLSRGSNRVRVEVFNGVSIGVAEQVIAAQADASVRSRGDLYVLAIGVSQFSRLPGKMALTYTARDAEEMAATLQRTASGLFERVHAKLVSDTGTSKPDKANILDALGFARGARAQDTVVVFLASHGVSDAAGNYYFIPRDADPRDVAQLATGRTPQGDSLVSWTHFFEALRTVAGRRVLIVDTCQARNIDGTFDAHSLAKRSASSRFALMVAARGGEDSQEYAPGKHGLFTYALLDGLNGGADADRNGRLTLRELFDHALPVVDRLRDRRLGPQSPQFIAPAALRDAPLGRVPAGTP